eukprot:scaffold434_cov186-Pinguiococcus_pyrenoidosus.AAC.68
MKALPLPHYSCRYNRAGKRSGRWEPLSSVKLLEGVGILAGRPVESGAIPNAPVKFRTCGRKETSSCRRQDTKSSVPSLMVTPPLTGFQAAPLSQSKALLLQNWGQRVGQHEAMARTASQLASAPGRTDHGTSLAEPSHPHDACMHVS